MRYSSQSYMGRTDTIDPTSLKPGDEIEVNVCDTSATPVWGYSATVREDGMIEADDEKLVNHRGASAIGPRAIDGCYTYLTVRRGSRIKVEPPRA